MMGDRSDGAASARWCKEYEAIAPQPQAAEVRTSADRIADADRSPRVAAQLAASTPSTHRSELAEPFVGREDDSAQMGPRQITAALDMVGVTTTTERCNGVKELLEALRIHFTASDDPAPCVYTNGKHVRVAVGVVVVAPGDVRLVYLDPIWDEVEVKVLRKHHLSRAPAYELLYLGA